MGEIVKKLLKVGDYSANPLIVIIAYVGYDIDHDFNEDDIGPVLMNLFPGMDEDLVNAVFAVHFWYEELVRCYDLDPLIYSLNCLADLCEAYPK